MAEFLQSTTAQAVIWVAVLAIIVTLAIYVATRFRNRDQEGLDSASDLLSEFRDLHDSGGLSPQEFREIKSVLGDKLQDELDSNDAGGIG